MKKLINQILKFGVVGIICFFIDFIITMAISSVLRSALAMGTSEAALIGAFFGFVISVIVNYLLSMKYVFKRREDMDRRREFIVFVILSVIGLGINELIILFCIDIVYSNWAWLHNLQQREPRLLQQVWLWFTTLSLARFSLSRRKRSRQKHNRWRKICSVC